jgi:hypothetical protein
MTYIPGQLLDALVDGSDAVVYLSLRVEGTNAVRKDHCYRYAPPSHEVVTGTIEILRYHEGHDNSLRPDLLHGKGEG